MGNKYFTTSDYNKLASNTLCAKITQKNLVNEYELNAKIKSLSTKAELKAEQYKIIELQTYDLSLFID